MNSKELKNSTQDDVQGSRLSSFVSWFAPTILFLAFVAVSISFGQSYFENCEDIKDEWNKEQCLSTSEADYRAAWGQFGDFMGGTVNPILGFLTIFLLVTELKESRRAAERADASATRLLELSQSQNHFVNHFKMIEEFDKYSANKLKRHRGIVTEFSAREFYSHYFQKSKEGIYTPTSGPINALTRLQTDFFGMLLRLESVEASLLNYMLGVFGRARQNITNTSNHSVYFDKYKFELGDWDPEDTPDTLYAMLAFNEIKRYLNNWMAQMVVMEELLNFGEKSSQLTEFSRANKDLRHLVEGLIIDNTGENLALKNYYLMEDMMPFNDQNAENLNRYLLAQKGK